LLLGTLPTFAKNRRWCRQKRERPWCAFEFGARALALLRYEAHVSSDSLGFPWHTLERLSADDVKLEHDARRGILELVDFSRLALVFSELFVATMDRAGVRNAKVTTERRHLGSDFILRADGFTVWLSLEPALVVMLLKRVVGQRQGLDNGNPLSEAIHGASLAVLAEVCRRVARGPSLAPDFSVCGTSAGKPSLVGSPGPQRAWAVDFFVRLDGQSFAGSAAISGAVKATQPAHSDTQGRALATPVALVLVVARCVLERPQFESLMLGDVVIPDAPILTALAADSPNPDALNGSVMWLCSPGATQALELVVRDAKLCLARVTELSYDARVTNRASTTDATPQPEVPPSPGQPTALDVVMQAPVVVHVEIGTVTLPAHAWLGLRPGDVVSSQVPIGQPVTLRVAEQAVAEGELVNVDGRVGVRLLRLYGA
jgi:type III secretion system YscQ/HrcQ family protein